MDAQMVGLAPQTLSLADNLLLPGIAELSYNFLDRAAFPSPGIGMPAMR
jgi:alpha-D-ribose 1-methylphosphonate 5-triphosphate diphosphatase PhnM